jgi:hypothetical protein
MIGTVIVLLVSPSAKLTVPANVVWPAVPKSWPGGGGVGARRDGDEVER